jgi:hypothetical protein
MTTQEDASSRPEAARIAIRRTWIAVSRLLVTMVFAQAIFAGVLLSGENWGRTAHRANALILIWATLIAGLVAAVTLRGISNARRLAMGLVALAVVLLLQTVLGEASANGAGLLWVHVPLGVALVGLSGQIVVAARRLGEP